MDDMDYLQNPEMWEDKLPQPYKTINRILRDVLQDTWARIEEREIIRRREAAQVRIPSGAAGIVLGEEVLKRACGGIEPGEDSVVMVGNGTCICALKYHQTNKEPAKPIHSGSKTNEKQTIHAEIINELNIKQSIIRLTAMQHINVMIILVQLDKDIKVFAFQGKEITEIADINFLHKEKPSRILNFTLSPTCTHLAVSYHCPPQQPEDGTPTMATAPRSAVTSKNSGKGTSAKTGPAATSISTDDSVIIALYSLPANEWVSELQKSLEMNDKTQETNFPKPPVLYYIPSPLPLVPCSAFSPAAIFQSVCDEKSQTLPSGDLHCLTEQYFENRWKHFVWKRQDFMPIEKRQVPVKSTSVHTKQYIPTSHFLYYKNGLKQELPCEVAIWWEDHSQLTIYPVKEGGKLATLPPSKRIPQASTIMCSASSVDSSLLALALKNGVVAVWSMKKNVCLRVVSCSKPPDQIIALSFFSDKHGNDHVGVGSMSGKLLDINLSLDISDPCQSVSSFTARTSKQQQVYQDMFASNEYNLIGKLICFITDPQYPNLLISLQDDGCVVVWNPSECEALYKFELSSSGYVLKCPPQYGLTKNGRDLLLLVQVASEEEEGQSDASYVLCVDLSSVPQLACYQVLDTNRNLEQNGTDVGKEAEGALLKPAETFLDTYTKSRYMDNNECIAVWENTWANLSNYLLQQT